VPSSVHERTFLVDQPVGEEAAEWRSARQPEYGRGVYEPFLSRRTGHTLPKRTARPGPRPRLRTAAAYENNQACQWLPLRAPRLQGRAFPRRERGGVGVATSRSAGQGRPNQEIRQGPGRVSYEGARDRPRSRSRTIRNGKANAGCRPARDPLARRPALSGPKRRRRRGRPGALVMPASRVLVGRVRPRRS